MGRQQRFYPRPMQIYVFPVYCPSTADHKNSTNKPLPETKPLKKRETVPTLTSKNGQVNNT